MCEKLLKKTIVQLGCAFDASHFFKKDWICEGEKRTNQFAQGFKTFFLHYNSFFTNLENIYVFDNTLKDKSGLDKSISLEIPDKVNFIFSNQNNYGKLNKGAGLIEGWDYMKEIFSNYEFLFYYEPRHITQSTKMVEAFCNKKTNIFIKSKASNQIQTGSLFVKISDILDYLKYRHPKYLCDHNISIEDDMYDFFKNIKKDNFTLVSRPGMLWHDSAIDSWREL